jgi:hypothetical protein
VRRRFTPNTSRGEYPHGALAIGDALREAQPAKELGALATGLGLKGPWHETEATRGG